MLGLMASSEREARHFVSLLKGSEKTVIRDRAFYMGRAGSKECVLAVSGSGKINSASATQLLIDSFECRQVINFGSCGALDASLKPGDVILATKVIEHDFIEIFPDPMPRPSFPVPEAILKRFRKSERSKNIIEGAIASGDEDVVDSKRRDELASQYGTVAVDQESAGISRTCRMNGVDFLILKIVTDMAHEHTSSEFESNLDEFSKRICRIAYDYAVSS